MARVATATVARRSWRRSFSKHLKVKPWDLLAAGRTSGALWLFGGVTAAAYPLLPGGHDINGEATEIIAGMAALWGLLALRVVRWRRVPPLLLQLSTVIAFPAVALVVKYTGGAYSHCWIYLWFVGYLGFYFYDRAVAVVYLLLCVVVQVLPLVYDQHAWGEGYGSLALIASGAYVAVGTSVIIGRQRFDALRERERRRTARRIAKRIALQRAATPAFGGAVAVEVCSKQAGHDRLIVSQDVIDSGIASAGDEWHERTQAIDGLRALARAIDAKDPATRQHSERVATFAGRLAEASGWSQTKVARLREAALVHDVGKLGVPDTILTKPGKLTDCERLQMQDHVELSAKIVGSVLTPEQVGWIRAHHERPDGGGYPCGLGANEIPDGAALVALADAWDVMVIGRSYNRRKSIQQAYEECTSLRGAQFTEAAVLALETMRQSGRLDFDSSAVPEVPDEPGGSVMPPALDAAR